MLQKKILLMLLTLALIVSLLAGCATDTTTTTPAGGDDATTTTGEDSEPTDEGGLYSAIDLSKPYTVNMFVLGDTPQDLELVNDEINKNLEADFNTSLKINFLAWSDWETRYSLVLAGGEDVDIMYTSSWAYYYTESAKGAFLEITEDFLSRAMPQTKENQNPNSWPEVNLGGKIYAIPRNVSAAEHTLVAIRADLREKHGIPELTDWDSYMNFLKVIAEKETPESGIWAHASNATNDGLAGLWDKKNELVPLNKAGIVKHHTYEYGDGSTPAWDDFFLYWDSDIFREFCDIAKDLREAGVWSQDAITNTVSSHDAFANGQGASILWNSTVFSYGKRAEADLGVTVEYYNLTEDKIVYPMPYVNDAFAIAAASKNPDRAGMVLDLLKNDTKYYRLIQGGIEGKHYIQVDDQYRSEGPDFEKYRWEAYAWGLNRDDLKPNDMDPRQVEMEASLEEKIVMVPTSGFVFDEEPVKNQLAAINALEDEYYGILTLGMAEDPNATIDEMVSRMEAAGLADIQTEGQKQYEAWLESKNG